MNQEFLLKHEYSFLGRQDSHLLPSVLRESVSLLVDYLSNNSNNNKLCLIFPTKEFVAQWLSAPMAFSNVYVDYSKSRAVIQESYKHFRPNDKLLLNNFAVVQWIGIKTLEKKGAPSKV